MIVSPTTVTYGNETSSTVTVTEVPQFAGTPTGTVAISAGGTPLCASATLNGSGVATCVVSSATLLAAGSYTVVSAYVGDTNFSTSSSLGFLTVTQATTAATLSVSPSSVALGHETTVNLTPTLTPTPAGAGTPTGSITITATNTSTLAATVLCTLAASQATGSHSCSPATGSVLITGTYTLVASYPGDPNFGSSASSAGSLTVTPAASSSLTLALTPSGTSVAYGNESAVTYNVSLGSASPTPTGTVAVTTTTAGNTVTLCTVTLTAGAGSCAISAPTLLAVSSTNPVVATYTGDANYSGSVSSITPVNLAITQASTTTNVSVIPTGVIYGSEHVALITATVAPAYAGTPSGTVAVTATPVGGGTSVAICAITLPASTCTPADTALPAGITYSLSGAFSGNSNFSSSTGAASGTLSVSRASTTTSLVLSASSVQYGTSPVFIAAVSPSTTGTPTGTVAILAYVSGSPVTLCTINLPATTCTGTGTALPTAASPFSVIAVYSGDGNYTTSTSSSQNLAVTSSSTSTIAILSPPSVIYGDESNAVISVTISHTGAGTPTGTVDVTYSGNHGLRHHPLGWRRILQSREHQLPRRWPLPPHRHLQR